MKTAGVYVLLFLLGGICVAARLVYSLFPLMPVVDVVFFGLLGFGLARVAPSHHPVGIGLAVTALPLADSLRALLRLGGDSLTQGVGLWWVLGLILIPGAAVAGAILGRRRNLDTVTTAQSAAPEGG